MDTGNNNNNKFRTVTNIETGETTDSYTVNAKEIEIIKREVTKQDVVLDIGANVGFLTTVLAEQAKKVYAFEPSPDNFKQLEENTKHFNNVIRLEMALSNNRSTRILYTCPFDNGMNRLYKSKWCEGGEQIEVHTMDLDRSWLMDKISFIKLDVEGYEYYAIQGMRKLLQRDHPTILMEWHSPSMEEAETDPAGLYYFMRHELKYNNPINCNTDEIIATHNDLDKQTRYTPAVNILWKYTQTK